MRTVSVRLPSSLRQQIRELAKREGISINQFLSTAAAEKLSALMTRSTWKNEPSGRAAIRSKRRSQSSPTSSRKRTMGSRRRPARHVLTA